MDINTLPPIEQAKAILGEFYRNYVIIAQPDDDPSSFELTYSDPFSTKALLECANNHQTSYLGGGTNIAEEWVWEEETDEGEDEVD